MICRRCGSECPERPEGLCLHCKIAVDLDEATGGKISNGTIGEGLPDWQQPKEKKDETKDST